jgi:hypothetical protein
VCVVGVWMVCGVWCVVWCGVVWCGVVWCGVVWCGVVWCGVVGCGVVWCGVVWCGVVWCGVVWCGVVWCGVVWCGVLCAWSLCAWRCVIGMRTYRCVACVPGATAAAAFTARPRHAWTAGVLQLCAWQNVVMM